MTWPSTILPNKNYVRFVDYVNTIPEHSKNIASEELVFMIVGLKHRWKCPVLYFLRDSVMQISAHPLSIPASLCQQRMDIAYDL